MSRAQGNAMMALLLSVGLTWIWLSRMPVATTNTSTALPAAPAIGHPAPELTLTTLAGEPFSLAELRGRPVIVNFWATWCPPCRAELPELESASVRLAGEVVIVGVNQGEDPGTVAEFIRQFGLTFPLPMDRSAQASRAYQVRSLPTTFFVDRDGIIRRISIGALTEATLAQALKTIYP